METLEKMNILLRVTKQVINWAKTGTQIRVPPPSHSIRPVPESHPLWTHGVHCPSLVRGAIRDDLVLPWQACSRSTLPSELVADITNQSCPPSPGVPWRASLQKAQSSVYNRWGVLNTIVLRVSNMVLNGKLSLSEACTFQQRELEFLDTGLYTHQQGSQNL